MTEGRTPPRWLDLAAMEEGARAAIGEMAYAYYSGGAERERLLEENVAAWSAWRLWPRVLFDVSSVSTASTVLGAPVAMPILVGPTALQRLANPEGELATARGAHGAGAAMVLSSLATCDLDDVVAAAPDAVLLMQVYILKDRARTAEMVHRAAAAGYRALVFTVDLPVSGLRTRELESGVRLPDHLSLPNVAGPAGVHGPGWGFMEQVVRDLEPALTLDDIEWLGGLSGLPVMVKGLCRGDDAQRCADAGAASVIVSNHGGRQLDDAPPTAHSLPEVVDAVGDRMEVYVDGGIRRASDVVKALALGAHGVLLGRPVLWALATGGAEGVRDLMATFGAELARVMALCGVTEVGALDRSLVRRSDGHLGERPEPAPRGTVRRNPPIPNE
ncbi:MAG: alpha-hydroxy acid oxidase [Acidimicrobiales bacterium]